MNYAIQQSVPVGVVHKIGSKLEWPGKALGAVGFGVGEAIHGVGTGLKSLDLIASGNVSLGLKEGIKGAAGIAATVAGIAIAPGAYIAAQIGSLLFTGKFLATNIENITGRVLDGGETAVKTYEANKEVAKMQAFPAGVAVNAPAPLQPEIGAWQQRVLAEQGRTRAPGTSAMGSDAATWQARTLAAQQYAAQQQAGVA